MIGVAEEADKVLAALAPVLVVFGITIIWVSMLGALALWKRVRRRLPPAG